jgi:Tat protein secretion system quality control protein TatD with DNase activity
MKIIDSHCHLDRVDLAAFGGSMDSHENNPTLSRQ